MNTHVQWLYRHLHVGRNRDRLRRTKSRFWLRFASLHAGCVQGPASQTVILESRLGGFWLKPREHITLGVDICRPRHDQDRSGRLPAEFCCFGQNEQLIDARARQHKFDGFQRQVTLQRQGDQDLIKDFDSAKLRIRASSSMPVCMRSSTSAALPHGARSLPTAVRARLEAPPQLPKHLTLVASIAISLG